MRFTSIWSSPVKAAFVAFGLSFVAAGLFAQQPKVLAPHRPIPPLVPQSKLHAMAPAQVRSMVGGLWMIDANFKSSIYLKNMVETSDVTVTPVLHLSNGTEYKLEDVKLEPSGTAIVDINAGLQAHGVASYATLHGYLEMRYSWPWDPICVTIRNLDATHSLIFTYGLQPSMPAELATPARGRTLRAEASRQDLDGLWWKQEKDVAGFVALANTTSDRITATVQLTDSKGATFMTRSISVSPHGMKLVDLPELDFPPSSSGGIHVAYDGPASGLIVNGGLEDQSTGYSAGVEFRSPPAATTTPVQMSFAELGLMVGAADPMMSFPVGTTFTPYSILRNISNAPANATPTLWWMAAGVAQSFQLPAMSFAPGQTHLLDVPALISNAGLSHFNGSVNLALDVQGKPGALLLAAGSVDQGNTYVFQVAPRGILDSGSKSLSYWSTGSGDDTMVTIWNPADEAQDLVFKLQYSGGHYLLPVHLGPRATQTLNISAVIENQIPDSEGNTVPLSVHEGSAKLTGSQADNQLILVASDVGVFNVKKATCGNECYTCDGVVSSWVTPSPFFVETDQSVSESFMVQWDTGVEYNLSPYATWNGGGPLSINDDGVLTGNWGQAASFSVTDSDEPIFTQWCGPDGDDPCPMAFGVGGGSSGQVGDSTPVITGITSPWPAGVNNYPITITGSGFGTNAPTLNISPSIPYVVNSPYADNTIHATVSVPPPDPTEPVTVSVTSNGYTQGGSGFYPGGGSQSPTGSTAGASTQAIPNVTPTIAMNGTTLSSLTSVPIVVGQQIKLTATLPSLQNQIISSQGWSVPTGGTAIGAFANCAGNTPPSPPNTNCGQIINTAATTTNTTTFYWVYTATTGTPSVTFTYQLSNGNSSSSTTVTFAISGPTPSSISMSGTALNQPNVISLTSSPAGLYFMYATSGQAGMQFNAPTGYSGSPAGGFQLVQLINSDAITGSVTITNPAGLDTQFPDSTTLPYTDSPKAALFSSTGATYTSLTRNFSATQFLMWKSSAANSIQVPIAQQTWGFSGTAKCISICNVQSNWSVTNVTITGANGGGKAGTFTWPSSSVSSPSLPHFGYPTWVQVSQ
jgi:hypothetical protein